MIVPGWIVEYLDTRSMPEEKNGKTVWKTGTVPIYGIWNGRRVQFRDRDKTVVRTTKWLRPLKLKEIIDRLRIKIELLYGLQIVWNNNKAR